MGLWEGRFGRDAKRKSQIDAWEKGGALLHPEEAQDSAVARERFEAGALGESGEAREACDATRIRKQTAINVIANGARAAGTFVIPGDLGASEFDEFAVFDAGGARGFAGAAVEAAINVRDKSFAEFEAAQVDEGHLTDSAARRIGFIVPEAIGGAGVEAEAAMNAARIVGVVGLVARGEAAESFGEFTLRFFVSDRREGGHLSKVAPAYCYAGRSAKVQKTGMALEASDETAGREDVVRVEGALDALVKNEVFAGRAPDVELALEFEGAVGNGGEDILGGSEREKFLETPSVLGGGVARREKRAVTDANAVKNVGGGNGVFFGDGGGFLAKRSNGIGKAAQFGNDGTSGCRGDGKFTDRKRQRVCSSRIKKSEAAK